PRLHGGGVERVRPAGVADLPAVEPRRHHAQRPERRPRPHPVGVRTANQPLPPRRARRRAPPSCPARVVPPAPPPSRRAHDGPPAVHAATRSTARLETTMPVTHRTQTGAASRATLPRPLRPHAHRRLPR